MDTEYYLSTIDEKKEYYVYSSESYSFNEDEILCLIKMCIREARNRKIGRKILLIYKDINKSNITHAQNKLKEIGIYERHEKPEHRKAKTGNCR